MQHKHRCTHARVTKQLFAGLAQGQFDYSAEMPIDGELQLVGMPSSSSFALITIKQRQTMLPQARYEAAITNKCHSLYVALVSSIVVVILVYSCTKLTWMYYLRRRYTYFSLALTVLQHPVLQLFSCSIHHDIDIDDDIDGVRILSHHQSTCKDHELMHLASNNVNNWQAYTAATHPNNVTRLFRSRYARRKMYVTCKLEGSAARGSIVVWYCVWSSESQR